MWMMPLHINRTSDYDDDDLIEKNQRHLSFLGQIALIRCLIAIAIFTNSMLENGNGKSVLDKV